MLSLRLVTLYSRSRFVPAAMAAIVAGTIGVLALDIANPRVVAVVIGLGAGAAAVGLGGADVQLERTGAISWPVWRLVHLVAIVLVITGLLVAVDLGDPGVALRDTGGLLGLAALGAASFGSQLAWVAPFVWASIAAVFPVADEEVLMWMIQPVDSVAALVVAAALGITGGTAYVIAGPRG